ncbi:unnamed protein product, partial [Ectocarpus sp. 12 AP-2014]
PSLVGEKTKQVKTFFRPPAPTIPRLFPRTDDRATPKRPTCSLVSLVDKTKPAVTFRRPTRHDRQERQGTTTTNKRKDLRCHVA